MRKQGLVRRFAVQQRGGMLALTAVMIAGVTVTLALAIDLGVLYVAHAEAQRAADGGALAGASAFLDFVPAATAVDPARDRAYEYTLKNYVRNTHIDSVDIQVDVDPATESVYVRVERRNIPMWFARLLGIMDRTVSASAVAAARPASSGRCIAPLALPDWWAESDPTEDADGDRIWDDDEEWIWGDDAADWYNPFGASEDANENGTLDPGEDANGNGIIDPIDQSGLGSEYRDGFGVDNPQYTRDWGRIMTIKPQDPHDSKKVVQQGWFLPIRLPGNTGGDDYRNAFTNCEDNQTVELGDSLRFEDGNMVGPTKQAIEDVVDSDPTEYDWTDQSEANKAAIRNSPRTLAILLFDPLQIPGLFGGNAEIMVTDIALFYIEGLEQGGGNQVPVKGRFLEYAQGAGGPGPGGSLVKVLQLIK